MKRLYICLVCGLLALSLPAASKWPSGYVSIEGTGLRNADGTRLFIRGTNLGNWLNPEGYMFGLQRTNSPRAINDMFCQLAGPDFAAKFWKAFKDNYITRDDIAFIASTGANTVRLPFHYKLFTDEDYMGLTVRQDGFARIDSVVAWCRSYHLYLILDMHDAPGGQTGDNIDDSYGYPWLFESEDCQQLYCDIWRRIAQRYRKEPVILGYELINEPIAPYFGSDVELLNSRLETIHKMAVEAIRTHDKKHIILLGGAQWNGNFSPFADWTYDSNIMYTCHRYGGEPTKAAIQGIIDFRDKCGLPMYMGEIGHNSDEWQAAFCNVLEEAGIGYTFWPYKKEGGSCFMGISLPDGWDRIKEFSEAPRATYEEIRKAHPGQDVARKAMTNFIEACKTKNCTPQTSYIESIKLKVNH